MTQQREVYRMSIGTIVRNSIGILVFTSILCLFLYGMVKAIQESGFRLWMLPLPLVPILAIVFNVWEIFKEYQNDGRPILVVRDSESKVVCTMFVPDENDKRFPLLMASGVKRTCDN